MVGEEPEDGEPEERITGEVDPVVAGTVMLGLPDGGEVEVLAGASLLGGAVPEPVWVRVVAPPLQAANTTAAEISSARRPDQAGRLRRRLRLIRVNRAPVILRLLRVRPGLDTARRIARIAPGDRHGRSGRAAPQ